MTTPAQQLSWDDLKLGAELREAISAAGWAHPTQVQRAAIPPMLKGSDVALQSRTGTGKTGAFVLPLLQRAVLWQHAVEAAEQKNQQQQQRRKGATASAAASVVGAGAPPAPIFLVLVPSVELCGQTLSVFDKLGKFVRPRCQLVNIPARLQQSSSSFSGSRNNNNNNNNNSTSAASSSHSASHLSAPIDPPTSAALVLISTPAFLVKAVKVGMVPLESVLHRITALVIDEADMLQSHTSMQFLYSMLPPTRQSVLLSATLTESVARLKGALLNQPVAVRVDEEAALLQQDADSSAAAAKKKKNAEGGDDAVENKKDADAAAAAATADGEAAEKNVDGDDGSNSKKKSGTNSDVEIRVVLPPEDRSKLKQHYLIATDECTKHTLLYSLFRFNGLLLPGKSIIFVDDDKEPYRLQHFLEQLGVSSLVYDLTLPVKARCDILTRYQEAEQGVLICTDHTLHMAERLQAELGKQTESGGGAADDDDGDDDAKKDDEADQQDDENEDNDDDADDGEKKKKKKKNAKKKAAAAAVAASGKAKQNDHKQQQQVEPGLSRGIDFNNVGNVILFQGVKTISDEAFTNYLHRVGRTARAGADGQSIALFTLPESKNIIGPLRDFLRESRHEQLRPFKKLDRSEAAALQYRVQAAVNNVTRHAAKKLRVANVAAEMGRSSYLATRLNAADTGVLRRLMTGATKQVKGDRNLRHVPDYMGIQKADDTQKFERRVSAQHLTAGMSRAKLFDNVSNAKRRRINADPLGEVAARVASSSSASNRAASKKGGARAGATMKQRKIDPTEL